MISNDRLYFIADLDPFSYLFLYFRDTFDKTLVFAVYDYDRFSSSDQTGKNDNE